MIYIYILVFCEDCARNIKTSLEKIANKNGISTFSVVLRNY